MPGITSRDVQRLGVVITDLYAATDLNAFGTSAVRSLRQIVPGDRTSYHHACPEPPRVTTIAGYGRSALPDGDAIVAQFLHEHYLVRAFASHGARRWFRTTDVLTRDDFHRSNLYEHYYRHMGIEFQIGVMFRDRQAGFLGMVVNREKGDFSERDRTVLDLLLPHLVQGQANAALLTRLQRDLSAFERGAHLANVGVVLLDPERNVQRMTDQARRWIARYFGGVRAVGQSLPQALQGWVADETRNVGRIEPRGPFVVERQGHRLEARLATAEPGSILILTETVTELPLRVLEALGLSRREAEVLKWVAEGKRNAELAIILGISRATAQHHLERIYRKLGVETRTAAVAMARDAAQRASLSGDSRQA